MERERVYLRGRIWWGWYYDAQGTRHSQSTKCRDKRSAEATVREWERGAADPNYAASNEATFESGLKQMILDRRMKRRAAGTFHMIGVKGGHIIRIFGSATPLNACVGVNGARMVDLYVTTRLDEGAAHNTVQKELSVLRSVFKVAKRRGEWRGEVATVMPDGFSAEYVPKKTFLTGPQVQRLLPELSPDYAAQAAFFIAVGPRSAEALRARREDIDLQAGQVWIRGTKTDLSEAFVPIVGAAWDLLEYALKHARGGEGGAMFGRWSNIRRDLHQACERAQLKLIAEHLPKGVRWAELPEKEQQEWIARLPFPRVSPNDLRRTLSTWLRQHGVEPQLIAPVLRHRDSRMVERVYGRMPVDTLGATLRRRVGDCSAIVANSGGQGRKVRKMRPHDQQKTAGFLVPRDGIEPPTRGFSIPSPRGVTTENVVPFRRRQRGL